ncbi:MAG: permease [Actinomycetes bacterium]
MTINLSESPKFLELVDSASCCDDTTSDCCVGQECCPPGLQAGTPIWKSVGTFLALVTSFGLSDYWFGKFLSSHMTALSPRFRDSLSFFISHAIGLLSLLGAITMLAVFARSFIDAEKVRDHMSRVNTLKGHGVAAGIGVATPFCSCSAVPVFTGFVRSGVPVSQAISFLVASPLVNEVSIVLLATSIGWAVAGLYAATGFAIAVIAGLLLRQYATAERTEVRPVKSLMLIDATGNSVKPSLRVRLDSALSESRETVRTTFIFILIGVAAGSLIHGWLPVSTIEKFVSFGPVLGVVAATAIGVPLYSGIATVIPVITALHEKGVPMGTLLAFSMSVTALSLPEALLLRKVMKPKLLAAYFGIVALGIIGIGILFNILLRN